MHTAQIGPSLAGSVQIGHGGMGSPPGGGDAHDRVSLRLEPPTRGPVLTTAGRPLRVALDARVSTRDKAQDPQLQLVPVRAYAAGQRPAVGRWDGVAW